MDVGSDVPSTDRSSSSAMKKKRGKATGAKANMDTNRPVK